MGRTEKAPPSDLEREIRKLEAAIAKTKQKINGRSCRLSRTQEWIWKLRSISKSITFVSIAQTLQQQGVTTQTATKQYIHQEYQTAMRKKNLLTKLEQQLAVQQRALEELCRERRLR